MATTSPLSGPANAGLRRQIRALVSRSTSCGPQLAREVGWVAGYVALTATGRAGLEALAAQYRTARGDAPRPECRCYRCEEVARGEGVAS